MSAWKSSTLLVLAAFTVSVLLLFTKSGMVGQRSDSGEVIVTNNIYSPAAADPELRSLDRAENLRRRPARATQVANTAPATRPRPAQPATQAAPRTQAAPAASPTLHEVPSGHVFYVVTATFSSRANADRGLAAAQKKGLTKSFVGTFDEGKFYSVIGNTFAEESSARYMVKELADKHGIKAYVYHKRD